jgi:hypothetical protein
VRITRNVAIATIAVTAAAAASGGAYAATQSTSTPAQPRQAFLSDVAKRLGIPESKLTAALKGAYVDELNAAVKASRLTQAQADALAKRIQQGKIGPRGLGPLPLGGFGLGPPVPGGPLGGALPGGGPPPGGPRGLAGPLGAAATYLGLSPSQVFKQLQSGKTLAQIAQSRGKSVDGLKQAMIASVRARLTQAVSGGQITSQREQQILSKLSTVIGNEINGKGPVAPLGGRGHWRLRLPAPGTPPPPGGPRGSTP